MADPTIAEIIELGTELQRLSAASKSEARADRELEDGSTLCMTSRQGAVCSLVAEAAPGQPGEGPSAAHDFVDVFERVQPDEPEPEPVSDEPTGPVAGQLWPPRSPRAGRAK